MKQFQSILPQEFDPVFDRIGREWMLITASDGTRTNTMTASWGGCGILWNKPVAICYIRPQRFTYPIVERASQLTLSFLSEQHRDALKWCGSHSGRDGDKFAGAGLTCAATEAGIPYPQEASLVLVCRKLYADDIRESAFLDSSLLSNYKGGDFHRFYICEIEQALRAEQAAE